MQNRKPLNPYFKQAAIARIREGFTIAMLAQDQGVSYNAMVGRLQQWNLKAHRQPHRNVPADRTQKIIEAYLPPDPKTLAEVGEMFGITRERVRQILAKAGVTERAHKRRNECDALDAERRANYERMLPLYLTGKSLQAAAKELGIRHWRGNPTVEQKREHSLARFWGYADKQTEPHPELGTPCWLWAGTINPVTGFPHGSCYRILGNTSNARRTAYILTYGDTELQITTKCQQLLCVNPDHLEAVTHQECVRRRDLRGNNGRATYVTHNGKTMNLAQWAKEVNMPYSRLVQRLLHGETFASAISRPKQQPLTLTHDGETHTIAQWAQKVGITEAALRGRLRLGWSIERVLTK